MTQKLHIRKLKRHLQRNEEVFGPWCLDETDEFGFEKIKSNYSEPWIEPDFIRIESERIRNILNALVSEYTKLLEEKHGLQKHAIFLRPLLINWLSPIIAFTHERRVQLEDFAKRYPDTQFIVEAMKIMNEIEAEYDCKIVEILAKDGDPIEYDAPVFRVERV